MITCIVVYFLVLVLTLFVLTKRSNKTKNIKTISITKKGIEFVSYYRHNINISNAKFIIIDKQVFIKRGQKRLVIKNIDNVESVGDNLYFTCLGQVEMLFDNQEYYKYFNVIIFSDKFNLNNLRHKAMLDVFNFPFSFENRQNFAFYIKIVRNILKVNFQKNAITVKANKYFLPFKIVYRLNGKIRKVNFNFR